MKICIDARWIFRELSGIGLYTQELIRALARIDTENDYILLFQSAELEDRVRADTRFHESPRFRSIRVPYGVFDLRSQIALPGLLARLHIDVFHSTNYMMPLFRLGRFQRVVTIHDLIPLLFPDHAPKSRKTRLFPLYRRLMLEVGRRAEIILAPSASTRRDILRELQIPQDRAYRVVVTPEGVTPDFRPGPRPTDRKEKVILYVGRLDPYKNVPRLVEALAGVRANGVPARLRLVGPPDPRYPEARDRARELHVEPFVDWVGYVSHDQLIREYQTADVFCLPSRYEGFGLTVLEAMACGTPCVCSNIGSLPEVAGDAARTVDPAILPQLVSALTEILSDPALWHELSRRGLQRAAQFTWERTARLTLDAYRRAAESASGTN
ncbi:MAG: glycosyltransferase family 4 protein [Kiritimatiellae bacterium]|nr:glycosyltransferase family 4 protein [Kiritimatiellia bacterium]MDW8458006.1 glycosyltransferase family 1 protein [Verrucomicrobiota bacterium]